MAHRPNIRAIKIHRSYTREEAALALGVSKVTVGCWMKGGLPHLKDQRPYLILGADLKVYLSGKKKPKQRCRVDELFCFSCRIPRKAAGGLIDYVPTTALSGQLSAICEHCDTIMHKNFSASKLGLLERQADVSFHQGDPRLSDTGKPRSNDHFEEEKKP